MRYHLIHIRMTTNNKYWGGYGEKGTLMHCWWDCKLVRQVWNTAWKFLKKLNVELPYDPVISLLGIYPKKTKTLIHKNICTPIFIAALFTIAKIWKHLHS